MFDLFALFAGLVPTEMLSERAGNSHAPAFKSDNSMGRSGPLDWMIGTNFALPTYFLTVFILPVFYGAWRFILLLAHYYRYLLLRISTSGPQCRVSFNWHPLDAAMILGPWSAQDKKLVSLAEDLDCPFCLVPVCSTVLSSAFSWMAETMIFAMSTKTFNLVLSVRNLGFERTCSKRDTVLIAF